MQAVPEQIVVFVQSLACFVACGSALHQTSGEVAVHCY